MTDLAEKNVSFFELQSMIEKKELMIEREGNLEKRAMVFAIQSNKGAAISKRVKNIISSQKLGSNLRHFISGKGRYFDKVEMTEAPAFAEEFRAYWLSKKISPELAEALHSDDGKISIFNYISAEILRERHLHGRFASPEVAYAMGLSVIAKDSRNASHESINRGFKIAASAMKQDMREMGAKFDGRQLAAFDAILSLNIQRAIKEIEESTLRNYNFLEGQMSKLITDAGILQIESGQKGEKAA